MRYRRAIRRLLALNTKAARRRRTQGLEEFHDHEVSVGRRRSRWLLKARDTASILFPAFSDDRRIGIVDSDATATNNLRQLIVGAAAGTTDPVLIATGAGEQWLPVLGQHLGPALSRMGNLTSLTLVDEKRVRTYRTAFTGRASVLWTVVHASDGTILSLARSSPQSSAEKITDSVWKGLSGNVGVSAAAAHDGIGRRRLQTPVSRSPVQTGYIGNTLNREHG